MISHGDRSSVANGGAGDSAQQVLDIVGVGLGPSNLSLAAMLEGSAECHSARGSYVFFERNATVSWHQGQLFPGSTLQNSFVRDLVTLADPTNRFSFLSFLRSRRRLLQFLNSGTFVPTREEFVQYLQWTASQLASVRLHSEVLSVSFDESDLCLQVEYDHAGSSARVQCLNVIIGTGLEPSKIVGGTNSSHVCIPVSEFLGRAPDPAGRVIVVVGGGQSAAECVEYLLSCRNPAKEIVWLTRSSNFSALDTSNFTREFYTPGYAEYFFELTEASKRDILTREARAESGISPALVESLYRRIYYLRHVRGGEPAIRMVPSVRVDSITETGKTCVVEGTMLLDNSSVSVAADCVVVCVGLEVPRLDILQPLARYGIKLLPPFEIDADYRVRWDGPNSLGIYLQSMALESHGLSDPNLTMVCHRNGRILNRIFGREVFHIDTDDVLAEWGPDARPSQNPRSGTGT